MKKLQTVMGLMVLCGSAAAWSATPAQIVFGFECDQLNEMDLAFHCLRSDEGVVFNYHQDPANLPADKKKLSTYHLNKIILRFRELGGKSFSITADYAVPADKKKHCSTANDFVGYTCRTVNSGESE